MRLSLVPSTALVLTAALLCAGMAACATTRTEARAAESADPLVRLKQGNERFARGAGNGTATAESRSLSRVEETGKNGQRPFAAVLTCADSRTPPEIFLDQGVGDLFVVRVAGNIADTMGIGSMEYAVEHLGVHLIAVVGHTKCGAVDAAVKSATGGKPTDGGDLKGPDPSLAQLVNAITPAVEAARAAGGTPLLAASTRANVYQSMMQLRDRSEALAHALKHRMLRVVGAIYDIDTGSVEWLEMPE